MLDAIKIIKANFKMSLAEFALGTVGVAAFIVSMVFLVLLGGSLV